jgi:hypothetical protein
MLRALRIERGELVDGKEKSSKEKNSEEKKALSLTLNQRPRISSGSQP